MYEKLIEALLDCRVCGHDCALCENNQKICCGSTDDLIDAVADAVELLASKLAALQSENAEKDREIERLVENCTKVVNDATVWKHKYNSAMETLSRVEAERDAACEAICVRCHDIPCLRQECEWWRGAQGEG